MLRNLRILVLERCRMFLWRHSPLSRNRPQSRTVQLVLPTNIPLKSGQDRFEKGILNEAQDRLYEIRLGIFHISGYGGLRRNFLALRILEQDSQVSEHGFVHLAQGS